MRVPLARSSFRTDSLSALALNVVEIVASVKQVQHPPVEYMADSVLCGTIGVPYIPAGQSLAISGTPFLQAPQYVEFTHVIIPAARHHPYVRKRAQEIVTSYTYLPIEQIEAWRHDQNLAHTKLQCSLEQYFEPQYQALKVTCTEGFTNPKTVHAKFPTLFQRTADGVRRGMDKEGVVATALGLGPAHNNFTPDDMVVPLEGVPYKIPSIMARRYLREPPPPPPSLIPHRRGPEHQKQISGSRSNLISINGVSPMVIASHHPPGRRQLTLTGPIGQFTAATTTAAINAEQGTVNVEPHTLEEVTELVSTMEKELKLKPITVLVELRLLLKPFLNKVHLENPQAKFVTQGTKIFPFERVKLNLFSPLYVRRNPRKTQYETAVHFCNTVTSYEQFKNFMLR